MSLTIYDYLFIYFALGFVMYVLDEFDAETDIPEFNFRDAITFTLLGGAIKLKAIFSNILCSLISGMACILVCYLGIGQHVEMIMIGNIMLLIPGVLMTNSFRDFISGDMISGLLHFSEAMITAVCVAAGFILSKIHLGGML